MLPKEIHEARGIVRLLLLLLDPSVIDPSLSFFKPQLPSLGSSGTSRSEISRRSLYLVDFPFFVTPSSSIISCIAFQIPVKGEDALSLSADGDRRKIRRKKIFSALLSLWANSLCHIPCYKERQNCFVSSAAINLQQCWAHQIVYFWDKMSPFATSHHSTTLLRCWEDTALRRDAIIRWMLAERQSHKVSNFFVSALFRAR